MLVFELPALPDPLDVGSGPVVLALAMLLAATLTRRLAADNPDVAIENMLMPSDLQDKSYVFIHVIGKIRRVLFSSA